MQLLLSSFCFRSQNNHIEGRSPELNLKPKPEGEGAALEQLKPTQQNGGFSTSEYHGDRNFRLEIPKIPETTKNTRNTKHTKNTKKPKYQQYHKYQKY